MSIKDHPELRAILGEILGVTGDHRVEVEVIEVPPGKTVEDVMRERGYTEDHSEALMSNAKGNAVDNPPGDKDRADPNWCEECQEVHNEDNKTEREAARQKTLKALRVHQARLLEGLDIVKALEKSIGKPDSERKPGDALSELVAMMRLKTLGL